MPAMAGLLAASCGSPDGSPPARPRPSAQRESRPSQLQPVEALRPPTSGDGARPLGSRNIFSFGGPRAGVGEGGPGAETAASQLPELPLPLPEPEIRLLGIAMTRADPSSRRAILSVSGDLVIAGVGDQIAGRYAVSAVGEDFVDLTDAVGGRPIHLAWP